MEFYTNIKRYGKNILFRGVENGKRVRRKIEYQPTLYIPSKKPTQYKTLYGEYVDEIKPGNMSECKDFLKQYDEVQGFTIYGNTKFEYAFISDNSDNSNSWDISYLEVANIDIEVGSENGFPSPETASEEITAITLKTKNKYYAFGCGNYTPKLSNVEYIKCSNEVELIKKFIDIWTLIYPDIVTGWNVRFFDIPYLVNRTKKLLGDKVANTLSPWNIIDLREIFIMNRKQVTYNIAGVAILDYLELYKKFGASSARESYKLDYICHLELGENKVSYEEYGNLFQLYKKNFEKFMDYNIHDVTLVEKLDDKLKLIELALTLAYDSKVNYEDVFLQTRMWDSLIYNHLKKKNVVIPQIKKSEKKNAYEGAYVKDPIVGMHDWVASFDLASLYPHLIMQYNLSPEMLIDAADYDENINNILSQDINVNSLLNKTIDTALLKSCKITLTPNKQFFKVNEQGFLGKMMLDMYEDRANYKNKAIEARKELEAIDTELKTRELKTK